MRVKRFAIHQTSKAMAALYALLGLVFVPVFLLANAFMPGDQKLPGWLVIAGPVFYGLCGYIMIALGCAIYNLMARFTGGVEFDVGGNEPGT